MMSAKKATGKGFTLAELLIVVGIIAVLVAVAIPVFSKRAESAREAYDIHTMRQAASAAVDLYYAGVKDKPTAEAAGLLWNTGTNANASGVYDPNTGGFLPKKSTEGKPYGKGTKRDGGMKFTMGNSNGAYKATEDYSDAVVLVSIFPQGSNKHVDVYWKHATNGTYVGGGGSNLPKLSIQIPLS